MDVLVTGYIRLDVAVRAVFGNVARTYLGPIRDLGRVFRIAVAAAVYHRDKPTIAWVICQEELASDAVVGVLLALVLVDRRADIDRAVDWRPRAG